MFVQFLTECIRVRCDYILNAKGVAEPLSNEAKADILETVVPQMTAEGLRTICLAYKDILTSSDLSPVNAEIRDIAPDFENEESVVSRLTCVAVFGIEDPVRPEVPAAIAQVQYNVNCWCVF